MEFVTSIPALFKTLSVFCLILLLSSKLKVRLSLSLFIGSLVLGFWMRLGPYGFVQSVFSSLTSPDTITLVTIVGFILIISRLMRDSGHLDRIVKGFERLSRDDRMAGTVMPALVGLLPMPGGALFSAPMVETAFCEHAVTGERKTAVNYWFRHIWDYWWPIYPGVVLAVTLLRVDTWQFMAIMFPMTLIMLLAGVIFILRPLGKMPGRRVGAISWSGTRDFVWEIMPMLVVMLVIMVIAGIRGLLRLIGVQTSIPGTLSIIPGLLASIIWVCVVNGLSRRQFRIAVLDRTILPMLFLVATIMVFRGVMVDSEAVIHIRNELMEHHIPVMLIILIMPFLSGLVTGIAIGFVGTSFPLIIPLFPPSHAEYLSYAALAYTFGAMGMMLSPVHLCFLVTKDYFKANLLNSYRYLFVPTLTVMIVAVLIFFMSRALWLF